MPQAVGSGRGAGTGEEGSGLQCRLSIHRETWRGPWLGERTVEVKGALWGKPSAMRMIRAHILFWKWLLEGEGLRVDCHGGARGRPPVGLRVGEGGVGTSGPL